jgi:hypothetical protein
VQIEADKEVTRKKGCKEAGSVFHTEPAKGNIPTFVRSVVPMRFSLMAYSLVKMKGETMSDQQLSLPYTPFGARVSLMECRSRRNILTPLAVDGIFHEKVW